VTTGIDMALAMVEEDHGRRVADTIAARLVLYARRPGFQSQFSDVLVAQTGASNPLAPVVSFIRKNLRDVTDTALLANKSGMSVRSLYRRCREQLDSTPAKRWKICGSSTRAR
jgi:transcriptional regulator GlxA family with amidase domain